MQGTRGQVIKNLVHNIYLSCSEEHIDQRAEYPIFPETHLNCYDSHLIRLINMVFPETYVHVFN